MPKPIISELEATVIQALNNAEANGYPPQDQTVDQNVTDLLTYHPELEQYAVGHIKGYVEEWLEFHP